MKVNFCKVRIRPSLMTEEIIEQDFTKLIADAIWRNARGVEEADFAMRLFHAGGELEITDAEKRIIESVLGDFLWFAQEGIKNILNA